MVKNFKKKSIENTPRKSVKKGYTDLKKDVKSLKDLQQQAARHM